MECTKVKFGTEEYALFHIAKYNKLNSRDKLPASTYKCKYCKSWHITSQIQNNELVLDNEEFRSQLIEQIKINVDLKAEVSQLNKRLKSSNKSDRNTDPAYQQMKETANRHKKRIKELTDIRNELLAKLNKFL